MRTKKNQNSFTQFTRPKVNPDEIESYLIDLEKATDEETAFWEDYWLFLAKEREKKIDDIIDSLFEAAIRDGSFKKCSRIVSAEYSNDPLCTSGSVKIWSNRFNFGNISASTASFQALYIGENFGTAFLEKYGHEQGTRLGNEGYGAELLRAQPGGFSHFELDAELDSFIDLRKIDTLQQFISVVKEIQVPNSYTTRAQRLFGKNGRLTTITSVISLKRALLFKDHAQWPTLLNQPSNSQWFGHYVKEARLGGIVYPSTKNRYGFNIAIFPDNLPHSSSYVKLTQKWPTIPIDRQLLNADNSALMQFKPPSQTHN